MDPASWRKRKGLGLRTLAEKLGRGWSSLRRWENGEREAPNSVVRAYEKASGGEVTSDDFARVRRRFLKTEEKEPVAA
jgi:transcriptional regulator with XRE-family HTH domain